MQLAELSEAQEEKLREWWEPQAGDLVLTAKYSPNPPEAVLRLVTRTYDTHFYCGNLDMTKQDCLPCVSVGQCIELLMPYHEDIGDEGAFMGFCRGETINLDWDQKRYPELIDALWQAVKTVL